MHRRSHPHNDQKQIGENQEKLRKDEGAPDPSWRRSQDIGPSSRIFRFCSQRTLTPSDASVNSSDASLNGSVASINGSVASINGSVASINGSATSLHGNVPLTNARQCVHTLQHCLHKQQHCLHKQQYCLHKQQYCLHKQQYCLHNGQAHLLCLYHLAEPPDLAIAPYVTLVPGTAYVHTPCLYQGPHSSIRNVSSSIRGQGIGGA
eukprot:2861247-Rhodomonas_salina.2